MFTPEFACDKSVFQSALTKVFEYFDPISTEMRRFLIQGNQVFKGFISSAFEGQADAKSLGNVLKGKYRLFIFFNLYIQYIYIYIKKKKINY